jgi:predicted alpha/beta-fold hydrolase
MSLARESSAASDAANRFIMLVAPERGGHCAFISRNAGPERFWAESRVVEFCLRQVELTE